MTKIEITFDDFELLELGLILLKRIKLLEAKRPTGYDITQARKLSEKVESAIKTLSESKE